MVLNRSSRVGLGALVALIVGSALAVWPLASPASAGVEFGPAIVAMPAAYQEFAPGVPVNFGAYLVEGPDGSEYTYCIQANVADPVRAGAVEKDPTAFPNAQWGQAMDFLLWKYQTPTPEQAAAIAMLAHQYDGEFPLGDMTLFTDSSKAVVSPYDGPVNAIRAAMQSEADALGPASAGLHTVTVEVSPWTGTGPAHVVISPVGSNGPIPGLPVLLSITNDGSGLDGQTLNAGPDGRLVLDVYPADRFSPLRVGATATGPGPHRELDTAGLRSAVAQNVVFKRVLRVSAEAVAQPLPGKVRIRKVSNNPRYQNPVGAQFEVRKSGAAVATLTIGGAPSFESQEVELPAGDDYTIVETVPPANHQLDPQERAFVLDPGESETLDTAATPFTNEPFKARVRVHKTNNNPEYQSVTGATFVLLDNDTGDVVAGSEMVVGASADPAKPGIAESNVVSVYPGTYVLHETVTPSGHFPAADQVITVPEQATDAEPIEVHAVENTVIPVRFNVQKVSLNKWYQSVAGAQFVLIDELTGIQEPRSEMTIASAAAGDPPGSAVSNTVSVRARRYILREVVPAVGHFGAPDRVVTLSPQPTVESAAINLTQQLVEETPKCKPIYIDKIDSDTRKPVAGVGLTLRRDHDNNGSYETLVGNYVTNGAEPVLAGDCLYEGNYELIEHSTPSPYSLPDTTIHYFHSWDQPLSLVHNDSIPVIFTRATSSGGDVPAELFDRVELSNVPPTAHGSITVNLYFAEPDEQLTCSSSQLVGTWTVPTQGSGSYQSPSHFVHENGTYTYVASYHGRDDQSTATHGCGEPNETVQFDAPVTTTTSTTTTTTTTSLVMAPVPVRSAPAFTGADAAGLLGLGATALGSGLVLARASRRTGRRSR